MTSFVAVLIIVAAICIDRRTRKKTVMTQPSRMEVEITVSDKGKGGLPMVTVKANGGKLNIDSVKQDSGDYIVSADKQDDNEVVISFEKKSATPL